MSVIRIFLGIGHLHVTMQPLSNKVPLPGWLCRSLPGSKLQPQLMEAGACPRARGCKITMRLDRLDLTLSFSSCGLYTSLYLNSHHTSAWEWLAFPSGSFDMEYLLYMYKHPHLHYTSALFSSQACSSFCPSEKTKQEVLQYDYAIQIRSNAKCSHYKRCEQSSWIRKRQPGNSITHPYR